MARYTGPKAKLCRREGVNLFGSAKYTKILTKKNYPPGMHGKSRMKKPSEYATQLREKQQYNDRPDTNERGIGFKKIRDA